MLKSWGKHGLMYIFSYMISEYLQAGSYVWFTYEEVYDLVLKIGASICSCGAMQVRFYAFNFNR